MRPTDVGVNREERYRVRDEAIRRIATEDPELSARQIAERLGCGHRVVQRVVRAMRLVLESTPVKW